MAYKHEHGDCLVPQHYEDNPQLGMWVSNQRRLKSRPKKSPLVLERIKALEEVDFIWNSKVALKGQVKKRPRRPRVVKHNAQQHQQAILPPIHNHDNNNNAVSLSSSLSSSSSSSSSSGDTVTVTADVNVLADAAAAASGNGGAMLSSSSSMPNRTHAI